MAQLTGLLVDVCGSMQAGSLWLPFLCAVGILALTLHAAL